MDIWMDGQTVRQKRKIYRHRHRDKEIYTDRGKEGERQIENGNKNKYHFLKCYS